MKCIRKGDTVKRSERIYEYIRERSQELAPKDLQGRIGFDAQEIADALDILRNNVSKELNALHRDDRIVKFTGRPVLYFDKATLEEMLGAELGAGPCQYADVAACRRSVAPEPGGVDNPFARLIGAESSLKRQVEQAKAAILYPPDGLHTLIVGQTGVGKTLFAHMMFQYGQAMQRFAPDAPFVTFNCADYYNNPQLLISHIFGHTKGAFTGADTAQPGLVEEADGGVLFLDEIHRLPPEGQEMIFYFMDTGTYNRLGETTRDRHAKVLIIGATTEDPDSVLTKTFVRRIPNIIEIKPLSERTLQEKIDILRLLFAEEAQRVKKPIRVGTESVKALIGSIGSGNVGQLKSNIKLLCAQAFLNGIDNPDYIEVDFKMLPPNIRNGLLTLAANRQALTDLTHYLSGPLIIEPSGREAQDEDGDEEPADDFNLYQVVGDKVSLLKEEGISADLIKQIVATDVNVYVKELYNKKQTVAMTTRERLVKIVDPGLVDFAEQVSLYVEKRLNRSYRDRFLYAFSLHLSAFLKRARNHETIEYNDFGTDNGNSDLRQVAGEIGDLIEQHYHLTVPPAEVGYIALLLESAEDDDLDDQVTIIVATHGSSTASSMVEVAQKLFNNADINILAVDMPLEVKPQDILDKMESMLRAESCPCGVLILADMGSLCNVGPLLSERLHIPVRTLDMVSTPLILEAMRKVDIGGADLESIYESLRNFRGYETLEPEPGVGAGKPEVIVTICSSGQGAALKLKQLVEEVLHHAGRAIEVVPVGVAKLDEHMGHLADEYRILAAIGMKKPSMAVPFIPIEEFVGGKGEQRLTEIIFGGAIDVEPRESGSSVVQKLCHESLQKFLTYLNPDKIMGSLFEFDRVLEQELGLNLSNPLRVRLIVHVGCALERCVTRSPLVYKEDKSKTDSQCIAALEKAAQIFEETLHLHFSEDEYHFMARMLGE